MTKPTRYDENLATYMDDSRRQPAHKITLEDAKQCKRMPPPSPNISLEQADSFGELARNLERKAREFAARSKQSLESRTDEYLTGGIDPKTDELNYGLLEANNRMIAAIIRRILGT